MSQDKKKRRFSIGLPNKEYLWVKQKSEKESRSMAGAIVDTVKKAMEAEEKPQENQ